MVLTSFDPDSLVHYGATFVEAFRASMSNPMTDKDAELEAKIRWGAMASAWPAYARGNPVRAVGIPSYDVRGSCSASEPWERAFGDAEKAEPGGGSRAKFVLGLCTACYCECYLPSMVVGHIGQYCTECARVRTNAAAKAAAPSDLTRSEALAKAKRLWGPHAYAFESVGKAPLTVGCPGIARGTGATFREAIEEAQQNRERIAREAAEGAAKVTAIREQNRAIGQGLMQPPEWAYPAAWRNAVMAAVEWANARPCPEPMALPERNLLEPAVLKRYHRERLAGTVERAMRRACGDPSYPDHEVDRIVCAAYERGRLGK